MKTKKKLILISILIILVGMSILILQNNNILEKDEILKKIRGISNFYTNSEEIEEVVLYFPDKNLYEAMKDHNNFEYVSREVYENIIVRYDDEKQEVTMRKDYMDQITELYLSEKDIVDISGIEKFINLKYISLSGNENLTNIDLLLNFENLKRVYLINIGLQSIEDIVNKKSIEKISFSNCSRSLIEEDTIVFPEFVYEYLKLTNNEANIYININNAIKREDGKYESGNSIESFNLNNLNDKINFIIDDENEEVKIELTEEFKEDYDGKDIFITFDFYDGKFSKVQDCYYGFAYKDVSEKTKIECAKEDIYNAIKQQIKEEDIVEDRGILEDESKEWTLIVEKNAVDDITEINLEDKSVGNLSGIEKLKNLRILNLNNTGVSYIYTLNELENLEEIYLNNTDITYFGDVLNKPSLKKVEISSNGENLSVKKFSYDLPRYIKEIMQKENLDVKAQVYTQLDEDENIMGDPQYINISITGTNPSINMQGYINTEKPIGIVVEINSEDTNIKYKAKFEGTFKFTTSSSYIRTRTIEDEALYDLIKAKVKNLLLDTDDENNKMTIITDGLSSTQYQTLDASNNDIKDFSGLDILSYLKKIDLSKNKTIVDLSKLLNYNVVAKETEVSKLKEYIENTTNTNNVVLAKTKNDALTNDEDTIELPDYIYETFIYQDDVEYRINYGISYEDYETPGKYNYSYTYRSDTTHCSNTEENQEKTAEIVIDKENQKAYLKLKDEFEDVREDYDGEVIGIQVYINSGKTKESTYTTFYELHSIYTRIQYYDENFANVLKNNLEVISQNTERKRLVVTKPSIESLEILDASNANIKDIDGIKKLKNLKEIDLSNNEDFGYIYELNNLSKLEKVNLNNTNVKDLNYLQNKDNIKEINISNAKNDLIEINEYDLEISNYISQLLKVTDKEAGEETKGKVYIYTDVTENDGKYIINYDGEKEEREVSSSKIDYYNRLYVNLKGKVSSLKLLGIKIEIEGPKTQKSTFTCVTRIKPDKVEVQYFPDENLYNLVKTSEIFSNNYSSTKNNIVVSYIDNDQKVELLKTYIGNVKYLDISNSSYNPVPDVTDFTGIDLFKNLEVIYLDYNKNIGDLSILLNFEKLKTISAKYTNIESVGELIKKYNIILAKDEELDVDEKGIILPKYFYETIKQPEEIKFGVYIRDYESDDYFSYEYDEDNIMFLKLLVDDENEIVRLNFEDKLREKYNNHKISVELYIKNGKTAGTRYSNMGIIKYGYTKINFEDDNFGKILYEELEGKEIDYRNNILTVSDNHLYDFNELTIYESEISNIKGIESLYNLDTLNLEGLENLTNVNLIKELNSLKHLNINNLKCEADLVDIINNLNNVETISINGNELKDISSFGALENLKKMELTNTKVESIGDILDSQIENLNIQEEALNLENNQEILILPDVFQKVSEEIIVNETIGELVETLEIKTNEDGLKYIELDNEINEEKQELNRKIEILVQEGKAKDTKYTYTYAIDTKYLAIKFNDDNFGRYLYEKYGGKSIDYNKKELMMDEYLVTNAISIAIDGNFSEEFNGIEDITGIENFVNLTRLKLDDLEKVTDISIIKNLSNLEVLRIDNAPNIENLDDTINNLNKLTILRINGSRIENLSDLEKIETISEIELTNTRVENIGNILNTQVEKVKIQEDNLNLETNQEILILPDIFQKVSEEIIANETIGELIEPLEIKTNEEGLKYIELDSEINEEKSQLERFVEIKVSDGKAKDTKYEYEYPVKEPEIIINFEDDVFGNFLKEKLNGISINYETKELKVLKKNVEGLTSLLIRDNNIKDITGIENLYNLEKVEILNLTELTDISDLLSLSKLNNVVLFYANKIVNAEDTLSQLKKLEKLEIYNVKLKDISWLEQMEKTCKVTLRKTGVEKVGNILNKEDLYIKIIENDLYLDTNQEELVLPDIFQKISDEDFEVIEIIGDTAEKLEVIKDNMGRKIALLDNQIFGEKQELERTIKIKVNKGNAKDTVYNYIYNVIPKEIKDIEVTGIKEHVEGQNFNPKDLRMNITLTDEKQIEIDNFEICELQDEDSNNINIKGIAHTKDRNENIIITVYNGKNLEVGQEKLILSYETDNHENILPSFNKIVDINVNNKILSEIKIIKHPDQTTYLLGQDFVKSGMVVVAFYENAPEEEITSYSILEGESLSENQKEVIVTYTKDGITKTAIQTINVLIPEWQEEPNLLKIKIKKLADKIEYIEGENFISDGMEISAIYSNGEEKVINNYEIINGQKLKLGQESITIKYKEGDIICEVEHFVRVEEKQLTEIQVLNLPEKLKYIEGENFDKIGIVVIAKYNNGEQIEITDLLTVIDGENLKVEQTEVLIQYIEKNNCYNISIPIEVIEKRVISINYEVKDRVIIYSNPKTKIEEFVKGLTNIDCIKEVYTANNEKVTNNNELIKTGMKVNIEELGEYEIAVLGDVNGDGKCTAVDSSIIKDHRTDKNILQGYEFEAADVSRDGKVNRIDSFLLIYYRAEKLKNFTFEEIVTVLR